MVESKEFTGLDYVFTVALGLFWSLCWVVIVWLIFFKG
jgi:hypothetical protein